MKTLKMIIEEKNMTIREAAADSKINENSICQIINGHRKPGRYMKDYIERWAGEALDWDINRGNPR